MWLDLGELNYSPAQYNLGVWYEKQASECLSLQDGLKRHYNKQAGHWYSCAVRGDSHPLAAYNLACLILDSEEPIIHSNSSDKPFTFTVTNLMKLAADGNVKQVSHFFDHKLICSIRTRCYSTYFIVMILVYKYYQPKFSKITSDFISYLVYDRTCFQKDIRQLNQVR